MATLIGKIVNATWSSSANWTDRATGLPASPADGDSLELATASGIAAVTGSDETATALHQLIVGPDFAASLGTSGANLQLSVDRLIYNGRCPSAFVSVRTHHYTDIVIDGADNTKITSAALAFTSNDVGKTLEITGGTGFTVQSVTVVSVAAGVATMSAAMGTVGSTGGTGHFQIALTIKDTADVDADEIATKGLHIKCIGNADLLNPFIAGFVQIEAETGSGALAGEIFCAGDLLHNYATMVSGASMVLAAGTGVTVVNWKPTSTGQTIEIREGATYQQRQTSYVVPASGPDITVRGGTLNWFASALINSIDAPAGLVDFSGAEVPFQIDGDVTIEDATLNIANGIRTPTIVGTLKIRGKAPVLVTDGNVNLTISYV